MRYMLRRLVGGLAAVWLRIINARPQSIERLIEERPIANRVIVLESRGHYFAFIFRDDPIGRTRLVLAVAELCASGLLDEDDVAAIEPYTNYSEYQ